MSPLAFAVSTVLVLSAQGYLRQPDNGAVGQGASNVAGAVPVKAPEPPLPAVGGPSVPLVGSQEPHTADPVVCGLLATVLIIGWIVACCCAAGAAGEGAAAAEDGSAGEGAAAAGAGGCFALIECCESIAAICS